MLEFIDIRLVLGAICLALLMIFLVTSQEIMKFDIQELSRRIASNALAVSIVLALVFLLGWAVKGIIAMVELTLGVG